MKKYLFALAFIFILTGLTIMGAPQPENKKPIVVDKMCYAQEIVEYEDDDTLLQTNAEIEEESDCKDCVCVCVRGSSKVSKTPDKAKICALIEILDTDITKSKQNNFDTFDRIVSALKDKGLTSEQISLEYFTCAPSYDYTNGRTLQGYLSSSAISVDVENIADIKSFIDLLTENGVTSICNIQYGLSTLEAEYANALTSALENAKTKASTMLGCENLKLTSIKEEMVFTHNNLCRSYTEGASTDYVGQIEVEAIVRAEFSCEC